MSLFYGMNLGFEESGPAVGWAKKCPVDTFLARGIIPVQLMASYRDVSIYTTSLQKYILT